MVVAPTSGALAQDAASQCTCVTNAVAGAAIGSVSEPVGDVRKSNGSTFVKVSSTQTLVEGSQVIVGTGANASLSAGASCNISLGTYQRATVTTLPDARICVQVSSVDPAVFAQIASGAISPAVVAGIGGVVIGGAILIGSGGDSASD
jgi:hypothetical protein